MTPVGLLLFLAGVAALRLTGGFALGGVIAGNDRVTRLLLLMPLSIVAAVIAVQTFTTRAHIVLDARIAGMAVAAGLAWRKVPMGVVVVIAACVTALVRAAGWG